jgi:uncharacterized repeat protein (TIGR03803 family)
LVQATNGNFYGTTYYGGNSTSACRFGCGTLFEITLQGELITVHRWGSRTVGSPSGLIEGTDGNLYGTTTGGTDIGPTEDGTVFKFSLDGKFTALGRQCLRSSCIAAPEAGLVQASDGNFYGTTVEGGRFCNGAIFQLTRSGKFTAIYSFRSQGGIDALRREAPMTQGTNGTLYGTTAFGGLGGDPGDGSIFSLFLGLPPLVEARPNFGKVGQTVGILGNDLAGTSSVSFNGTPGTFTVISNTFIKATVPEGATAGQVEVTTPGGRLSSNVAFQVLPRPPWTGRKEAKKNNQRLLKPSVLYWFRHTFLTRQAESGCDAWTMARIAGWSDISISKRYVHPSADAVLNALSKKLTQLG